MTKDNAKPTFFTPSQRRKYDISLTLHQRSTNQQLFNWYSVIIMNTWLRTYKKKLNTYGLVLPFNAIPVPWCLNLFHSRKQHSRRSYRKLEVMEDGLQMGLCILFYWKPSLFARCLVVSSGQSLDQPHTTTYFLLLRLLVKKYLNIK